MKQRCSLWILLLVPIALAFIYGIFGFGNFMAGGKAYPFSLECLVITLALCAGAFFALAKETSVTGIIGGVFMSIAGALALNPFWANPKLPKVADLALGFAFGLLGYFAISKTKTKKVRKKCGDVGIGQRRLGRLGRRTSG